MKVEELKSNTIFLELQKNKKVQQSAVRLGKTTDWAVLKNFVTKVKQVFMEASFETGSLDDIKRYKHLIRGMESIVLLPELVALVKETEKKNEADKEEKEREAKRMKFNPGGFVRTVAKKVKGVR